LTWILDRPKTKTRVTALAQVPPDTIGFSCCGVKSVDRNRTELATKVCLFVLRWVLQFFSLIFRSCFFYHSMRMQIFSVRSKRPHSKCKLCIL
jgi:hypothetical protein